MEQTDATPVDQPRAAPEAEVSPVPPSGELADDDLASAAGGGVRYIDDALGD